MKAAQARLGAGGEAHVFPLVHRLIGDDITFQLEAMGYDTLIIKKGVKYWMPSFKEGGERSLGRDITHVLRPPDLTTTPKVGLLSFLIP